MALFLPNNTASTYGYGGYGYASYGTSSFPRPDINVDEGFGGGSQITSYGGWTIFPRPDINVDEGYGGVPYGLGVYGSIETFPPVVTSAVSLDGTQVQVFFNEEMLMDSDLTDPASYTITSTLGAAPTVISVEATEENYGAKSVILNHSGTTLGGSYEVQVRNIRDLAHNLIDSVAPTSRANFFALGTSTIITGTSTDGNFLLSFSEPMGTGATDIDNYVVASSYPVPLVSQSVSQTSPTVVDLVYLGITKVDYKMTIGKTPAISIDSNYTMSGGVVSTNAGHLYLSKEQNDSFEMVWADESAPLKVLPNSSYVAKISVDFSSAHIRPYYLTQPIA